MNSVARLLERFSTVQNELTRVLKGLMTSDMGVFAAGLNASAVELSGLCERAVLEVWGAPDAPKFVAWHGHPLLAADWSRRLL